MLEHDRILKVEELAANHGKEKTFFKEFNLATQNRKDLHEKKLLQINTVEMEAKKEAAEQESLFQE